MRHCEYIKPNGEFCGTPALRGRDYCHWHLIFIARRLRMEKQEATADRTPLELPPFEDANSIQLSIMMVVDAILHDRIGPKKSGQVLYALQLASTNLKQGVCFQPGKKAAGGKQTADEQQEPEEVTLCSSYDSLEADYDIPEHAEQLKASQANRRLDAAEEAEEEDEQEGEEEKELTEEEQFMRWIRSQGFCFGDAFRPGSESWEMLFPKWRREMEECKRHWDGIRHDLSEAAANEDAERLKEVLADCYDRAGLEYETEGWKPAAPQKVLFPRKPPAGVEEQWYEQRKANSSAEMDKHIAEQEAARKKIG
jgi:hypothetical protein